MCSERDVYILLVYIELSQKILDYTYKECNALLDFIVISFILSYSNH